jgi:hypothetical protein
MLQIDFVDFEKEYVHCIHYKRQVDHRIKVTSYDLMWDVVRKLLDKSYLIWPNMGC